MFFRYFFCIIKITKFIPYDDWKLKVCIHTTLVSPTDKKKKVCLSKHKFIKYINKYIYIFSSLKKNEREKKERVLIPLSFPQYC